MKKYIEILKKCPLFNSVKDDNLSAILGCIGAKVIKVPKGKAIFSEGEKIDKIGIVLSGILQIERIDYYGNRSIVTNVLPSELFGEAFACSGNIKIPFDIVATEKSEVMLVDCQKVIHACNNACEFHNQLVRNLLHIVAQKNLLLNQKIEILSGRTTKEKARSIPVRAFPLRSPTRSALQVNRRPCAAKPPSNVSITPGVKPSFAARSSRAIPPLIRSRNPVSSSRAPSGRGGWIRRTPPGSWQSPGIGC